jgi:hypothetical protein
MDGLQEVSLEIGRVPQCAGSDKARFRMSANDQVHIHTRRIREQPFLHILHPLEEGLPVVRHKHLVARLERSGMPRKKK